MVTSTSERQAAARAREAFEQTFGSQPAGMAFAPGRVNLVGEHTDYNDGFVLPMAIAEGIAAAFSATDDDVLRVHAADMGETQEMPLAALRDDPLALTGWFRYVAGMAWTMNDEGLTLKGTTIALAASLPVAAGLSSSAAIEMVSGRALAAAAGIAWDPRAMSLIGQRAEQEFAGLACGIMDQMAVACAHDGRALLLDCRSFATTDVVIPSTVRIVIVHTGLDRALTSSAYNDRRAACERAVAAVHAFAPGVHALRDVDERMLADARESMDEEAFRRASHVVAENRRPAQFAAALAAGDLTTAGRVMLDSHASLRDLYEVSCPELDLLVGLSMEQAGCHGARLTGAGFGGCAIALVDETHVESFATTVARAYEARTRLHARTIISRPSAGTRLLGT
jgi:galactokinase